MLTVSLMSLPPETLQCLVADRRLQPAGARGERHLALAIAIVAALAGTAIALLTG